MRTETTIGDCGTGGGGGGGSIDVQQDGVDVVNPATTLNFTGDVVVTDAGGGTADIAIGGGRQTFRYTATGAEGDDFVLNLPAARTSVNYNAIVTGGGMAFQLTFDVADADNTLTTIHVLSSAVLISGDILNITVVELDGGGGGVVAIGVIQSYRYMATGAENPAGFIIPLQTVRTDALYNAFVSLGDTVIQYERACPPALYTNANFTCIPGTAPTAGDVLLVLIVPTT